MTYAGRGADQAMIRMPEGMRDEIAATAKANGRSMNSEIIARLSGDVETLRDKLAGHALAGMMASEADGTQYDPAAAAERAYKIADAMLAARKAGA
jgi:hypothetical protein